MKNSVILTGNKGLIGSAIEEFLRNNNYEVIGLDIETKLDISDNVKKIMNLYNKPKHLINTFALNDHIEKNKINYSPIDSPLENFRKYLEINVTSLYSVCREFIKTRPSGTIINFSSIYGLLTPNPKIYEKNSPKDIGYPVSKSAVISLSNYLAVHYAPNFRINTLVLGGIQNKQPDAFIEKYSDAVPLKRMMQKEELLPSIMFLLDPKNSYMTGSTLSIDGGYSLI
tara:strand:+ start:17645 stop:18325 length:681 start_codon:yes stop_codon:yes gene_type:complete